MLQDPIGDFLNKISNAYGANKKDVVAIYSKINHRIADILKDHNYILDIKKDGYKMNVQINLDNPILKIKRVSRPTVHFYVSVKEINPLLKKMGITIMTTPKGVMTASEAKKLKVGGEIICEVV